jgi:thiamine-phosphate pyrophosphorylase
MIDYFKGTRCGYAVKMIYNRRSMERSGYRIIDANFNRAREALRVIEDYCRFALNCGPLSGRVKDLRHRLSSTLAQFDSNKLLASRETESDVGIGQTVKTTIARAGLKDALTAACKRLPEALRVLAETIRLDAPEPAEQIEQIRYAGYTLEKDIALFADTQAKFAGVRLYVIISSNVPDDVFTLAENCVKGGADCIQLRAKDIDADKYFVMADEFVKICRRGGVLSVINDRVDIAVASGADGVHLGQDDLPVEQARKLQFAPLIIGKSTHSITQLNSAIAELPTYVSLGPIFATPTKPKAAPVTLDYVKQALPILSETGISHVAIGGITLENLDSVLQLGVKTIAVSSAVIASQAPRAACRKLKEKIEAFFKQG